MLYGYTHIEEALIKQQHRHHIIHPFLKLNNILAYVILPSMRIISFADPWFFWWNIFVIFFLFLFKLDFIFLYIDIYLPFTSPLTRIIVEILIVVIGANDRLIDQILAAGIAKYIVLIKSAEEEESGVDSIDLVQQHLVYIQYIFKWMNCYCLNARERTRRRKSSEFF